MERSRSGNGAHVWFFFSGPVLAADARKLWSGLLTHAMSRRHQLQFKPYDRLFPAQDTLPRGGFSNLIALPFQGRAQRGGNTLFVDEKFTPYQDQWAFLSTLHRITPEELAEYLARPCGGELRAVPADESPAVVATGKYVGEGFDEPRLDTVLLTMPDSWRGMLAQYAGRLHRNYEGKREVRVHDYADILLVSPFLKISRTKAVLPVLEQAVASGIPVSVCTRSPESCSSREMRRRSRNRWGWRG